MGFASTDASFNGAVANFTFKEILAGRYDLAKIIGGRIIPPAAETIYYAGQVLCQYTSGPNQGLYVPYDSSNSGATDGSQKPVGFLLGGADVDTIGSQSEVSIVIAGEIYSDLAVTNVAGVQTAGLPVAVATALGGKIILVHGQNQFNF